MLRRSGVGEGSAGFSSQCLLRLKPRPASHREPPGACSGCWRRSVPAAAGRRSCLLADYWPETILGDLWGLCLMSLRPSLPHLKPAHTQISQTCSATSQGTCFASRGPGSRSDQVGGFHVSLSTDRNLNYICRIPFALRGGILTGMMLPTVTGPAGGLGAGLGIGPPLTPLPGSQDTTPSWFSPFLTAASAGPWLHSPPNRQHFLRTSGLPKQVIIKRGLGPGHPGSWQKSPQLGTLSPCSGS